MTNEEWATSNSAPAMLEALRTQEPTFFQTLTSTLHRYFIACSWKIKHLIPQKGLRNGLRGTEQWADGLITDEELYKLDWYAEADCFTFDFLDRDYNLKEVKKIIASIEQLKTVNFDEAVALLSDAAYFAEGTLIYPKIQRAPYYKRLFTSQFLCPDLLREFIVKPFVE